MTDHTERVIVAEILLAATALYYDMQHGYEDDYKRDRERLIRLVAELEALEKP